MANVQEILVVFKNFLDFASIYCLIKCLKAMLCGIAVMPFILFIHRLLKNKLATTSCYIMLLLALMPLMGMSRLFYQRHFAWVTVVLSEYAKVAYGYIYFGVMFVLAGVFAIKMFQMKKNLKSCAQITKSDIIAKTINQVTDKDKTTFQRKYLGQTKIYIVETDESPFSGGLLNPYIVMPKIMWENWDEKRITAVLCHEMMHIKSGHILWITIFKVLTILWWINPLIYLCEAILKEDIEHACDERCILYAGISKYEYGCLLLAMIEQINGSQKAVAASFLNKTDFTLLRKRLSYIAGRNNSNNYCDRQRLKFELFCICMLLIVGLICTTSYPRYTILHEVTLFGEDFRTIAYEEPLVQEAFKIENGRLLVDKSKFEELVASENITDEYVYASFDTIMKLPGMGGLGNVGMVNVADSDDIFYLSEDTLCNRILAFCLKYLI